MLATGYNFWSEWELREKVDFDGINKLIIVYPHVTNLDIREDVFSAWVRWNDIPNRGYDRYLLAMESKGLDTTPVGQTGDLYFLRNGWKLIIDFSKVAVTGVLFSRDFDTPYYTYDLAPQYAATISTLVNSVTSETNVVTGDISTVPDVNEIAAAVWANIARTLTETVGLTPEQNAILLDTNIKATRSEKANFNRRKHDKTAKTVTLYENDKATPMAIFDAPDDLSELNPR